MKLGKIAFVLFLQGNCIVGLLSGQDTLIINGRITDRDSKETVIGANVFLDELGLSTFTDFDGKFNFTLIDDFSSLPTATIRAKYTGYPPSDSLIVLRNYINMPLCFQRNLEMTFETPSVDFHVVPFLKKP